MNMGIGLIAIGMFFAVNPVVTIIDIIPDFIGCILVAAGLDRLADMEDHFSSAKRSFIILAVISGIKTAVCALLPFIDGTFIILLAFVFAVGEAVCFIPGIINIFGGFHYYGMRLESNACYGIYALRHVSYEDGNVKKEWKRVFTSDGVLTLSIVSFVVRQLASFVPMVPVIFEAKSSMIIGSEYDVAWSDFIPHLYVLCGIIALAVCIPWAVNFCKYIKGIAGDEMLMGALNKKYEESIAHDEGYFAEKQVSVVKLLTVLGAVFCFSIYMDYVNWLPGGVAGIFFASAAIMLRRTSGWSLPTAVAGFMTVIPSALEVVFQYQYAAMKYTPESYASGIGGAEVMYPRIMIAEIAGALMLIVTVFFFSKCLRDMTAAHSVLYEKALPETRSGRGPELCAHINKAYGIAFALMAAMTLASGLHGVFAIYYPESWLLNGFIGIAMMIFLIRAISKADDELYDKLKNKI